MEQLNVQDRYPRTGALRGFGFVVPGLTARVRGTYTYGLVGIHLALQL